MEKSEAQGKARPSVEQIEMDHDGAPNDQFQPNNHDFKSLLTKHVRETPLVLSPPISPYNKASSQAASQKDDHSFALFANSFDTLSEPGRFLSGSRDALVRDPASSPPMRGRSPHGRGSIEIDFPDLEQDAHSDYSLGDLSPIKLVYAGGNPRSSPPPPQPGRCNGQSRPGEFTNGGNDSFVSNPFYVIRSARKTFEDCKYLLPCLRGMDVCSVHISEFGHIRHYKGQTDEALSTDIKIATRRVEAAICAFGGSLNPKPVNQASSIFRLKGTANARQVYEQRLPSRYHLSGSRISWEVEEDPPVVVQIDDCENSVAGSTQSAKKQLYPDHAPVGYQDHGRSHSGSTTPNSSHMSYAGPDAPKMKYRCKLCGQLKQNHNCPYRHSLQRSIGVMVYPAVNSFTAAEPGEIAPPLTKMNNFVSYDSDKGSPSTKSRTPYASKYPGRPPVHPSTVTPEALRSGGIFHSPQSSLSVQSEDATAPRPSDTGTAADGVTRKRTHSQVGAETEEPVKRSLFVASVTLRPEHYRAVTPAKENDESSTAYQYPVVPLTFAERKRLSDTLFYLSKEIPTLTGDCAAVLREARENNEWDLAVAELLTQVVVGLYCGEGDSRLDGLQQYLLALGISC